MAIDRAELIERRERVLDSRAAVAEDPKKYLKSIDDALKAHDGR